MIRKFCFALSLILLTGCGTDSGNPGLLADGSSEPVTQDLVVSPICNQLKSCDGVELAKCHEAILTAPGMTSALGLNTSSYATLQSAIQAQRTGQLKTNFAALEACQNAITALTCGSSLVTSAFAPTHPDDFSQAYVLLSANPACTQIFAP